MSIPYPVALVVKNSSADAIAVSAYKAARSEFKGVMPIKGQVPPANPDATVVLTGPNFGNDGAAILQLPTVEQYYIVAFYDGYYRWQMANPNIPVNSIGVPGGIPTLDANGRLDKLYRPYGNRFDPSIFDGDDWRGSNGLATPRVTWRGVAYNDIASSGSTGASTISGENLIWGKTDGTGPATTGGASYMTATLPAPPDKISASAIMSSKNYLGATATTFGGTTGIICSSNPGGFSDGFDIITGPGGGAVHCAIFGNQWSIGRFSSRTDTATGSAASSTITDASITAADAKRAVAGTNIPANSFVGWGANAPTVGTSFTLVNASNTPINPSGTVTQVKINQGYTTLTYKGGFSATGSFSPSLPLDTETNFSVQKVGTSLVVQLPAAATLADGSVGSIIVTDAHPDVATYWGTTIINEPFQPVSSFQGLTKQTAGATTLAGFAGTIPVTSDAWWPISGTGTLVIRTDTVTGAANATSITDASCVAADAGLAVVGTNVPAGTFVGVVTAGTSFTLVDGSNNPVHLTGAVTSITLEANFSYTGLSGNNVTGVTWGTLNTATAVLANASIWSTSSYLTDGLVKLCGWNARLLATTGILAAAGGSPTVITASGAYSVLPPAGCTHARITCIGAGGGGGGGGLGNAANPGGGGGGAGGIAQGVFGVSPATPVTGGVGTGGSAGTADSGSGGGNGGTGSTTNVTGGVTDAGYGTSLYAAGGGGGGGGAHSATTTSSAGGPAGSGRGTTVGGPGWGGVSTSAASGASTGILGLSSCGGSGGMPANGGFGGNGGSVTINTSGFCPGVTGNTGTTTAGNGATGTRMGQGGGGGGGAPTGGTAGAGGAGAPGAVIIEWLP